MLYDQNYPPGTTDFSSMMRAIRAARPDMVFVMSYPAESVLIVRAVGEIGVGASVKVFGGGMVGLQYTPIMESLGSALNGILNYNTYVPGMRYEGIDEFLCAIRSARCKPRSTRSASTIRRSSMRSDRCSSRRSARRGACKTAPLPAT